MTGLASRRASDPPVGQLQIHGDISSHDCFREIDIERYDVVVHLAAAGVGSTGRAWPECIRTNVIGTLNLLEALRGVTRPPIFLVTRTFYEDFVKSSETLGSNPYVVTKLIAGEAVRQFAEEYQGRVVAAKLYQIYGPSDPPDRVLPYTIECLKRGVRAQLGSGRAWRDWLYVSDLVEGLLACMESAEENSYREFDLGSGELHQVREVLMRAAGILGQPTDLLEFDPKRDRGDIEIRGVAARWPPGWYPRTSLEVGLKRTILGPDRPE